MNRWIAVWPDEEITALKVGECQSIHFVTTYGGTVETAEVTLSHAGPLRLRMELGTKYETAVIRRPSMAALAGPTLRTLVTRASNAGHELPITFVESLPEDGTWGQGGDLDSIGEVAVCVDALARWKTAVHRRSSIIVAGFDFAVVAATVVLWWQDLAGLHVVSALLGAACGLAFAKDVDVDGLRHGLVNAAFFGLVLWSLDRAALPMVPFLLASLVGLVVYKRGVRTLEAACPMEFRNTGA